MQAIAAVDGGWGIGYKGKLLVSIPEDLKRFRELTLGKTVIYGRKTLMTFPGGKPLKKRRNIILTTDPEFTAEGAEIAHSVEEALELVKGTPGDDIVVIGGESVYREFLPYVDRAEITAIDYTYQADAHFPNLDEDDEWELAARERGDNLFRHLLYVQDL